MTRKSRHIRRSTVGILMAFVAALAGAGTAFAAWSSSSAAGSSSAAAAQSMTAGHAPVLSTSASNISLSWAASPLSGSTAPDGYVVRRYNSFGVESTPGGTCSGTVGGLTCTDTNIINGTWTYSVTPVLANWKGAESTKSSIALNAAPPVITMTTPTASAYYRAATWNNISGTASSGSGLGSVSLSIRQGSGNYFDGTSFSSSSEVLLTASGTTNWSYALASSKLSDGAYTVRVVATDVVGNSSTNSTLFNYDNTAPTATFSMPAYIGNVVTLSATVSGATSVSYYYCPGSSCTPSTLIASTSTSPYSVVWVGMPADGTYTVSAVASDLAGNTATSSDTAILDNSAPITTDNTGSIGSGWKNSTQTVTLSATDGSGSGVASTRYTTDGSTPTGSSTSGNSITLSNEGTYTIKYFSKDALGNTEAVKTATNPVNIDKTAPTAATITALGTYTQNGQVLTATGADALSGIGSVNYYYCLGTTCTPSTLIGTSTDAASSYALTWNSQPADGSYRVLAHVFDKAGNSKDSSITSTKIDNNAPVISISSPADGGSYRSANWGGSISGSASDTNLSSVGYTLQRVSTGKYWNGTSFSSSTPVTITPTGTTSWSKSFTYASFPAEDDYTVVATATDGAGNSTTDTSTFTIDATRPSGADIQGVPAASGDNKTGTGDQIIYTFSEQILPSTIKTGWDGTSTNVTGNFDNTGAFGNSSLAISSVNLGSVDLGDTGTNYVSSHGNRYSLSATMVMTVVNGKSVVTVTLTSSSNNAVAVNQSLTMRWTPSGTPTDPAGNTMLTTTAVESTGPRKNF